MNNDNIFEFQIDEEHAGDRIDSVLSLLLSEYSRSYIVKLIESGNVFLNEERIDSKKLKLKDNDNIRIVVPEPVSCEALPEEMELDIVYEDDDVVVVNKPKGLVVHPGAGNPNGTLVNGLLYHCKALSTINGVERPGIVHRIDKDTSGLLLVAKNDNTHQKLSVQFEEHSINRIYTGVCYYNLKEDFTVDAPLGRDPKNRLKMAVIPDGRRAVTHIKTIEQLNGYTLFNAKLETGRTHQIRVHMAYKHHPLLGDMVYGPAKQKFKVEGQMLHAGTLGFVHPSTAEYLEFTVEPPKEFTQVIERLRND
ncbi:MAG: RluA family pseudouridine synthase [Clostridia bacterium]|nr:RluA family pseudouridine synthase [Clostridia bacterium]